ncbi:MAG: nickel-dependent hydrogenase large subunit [Corynebacterium sp.]|nr:nickel-dependent hydrogenase large subunit [Corynebacterium sp.]
MSTTLRLDHFLDPFEARVVITADGPRFDLSALPRLDGMLVGRSVVDVPDIVKRLCGICPVTHHLAGVRALDQLFDAPPPPAAQNLRRLLHYGSVLDAVAPKLIGRDPERAIELKRFGKAVLAAAGCPGHFPDVAIPGGVRDASARVPDIRALEVPQDLEVPELTWVDGYGGASIRLETEGKFDPLGGELSTGQPVARWPQLITETHAGQPAPRPLYQGKPYRVGPLAQFGSMHPLAAQVVQLNHALAAIRRLLRADYAGPWTTPGALRDGTGVGLIDGPRGILAHVYTAVDGVLTECQILTPTAQNEPWLADMLAELDAESAIRAADPCLPCTSAPEGQMNVRTVPCA